MKLIVYLVVNLCCGIKRATACPLFLTQNIAVMHWSEPKSYNKLFELLHSQYFGFRGPMLQLQEILLPKQVAYNNSLALQPPVPCAGHDSCRVLWVLQPCLPICRWVLSLHHHPLWHVMKRLGNKVVACGWQV